MVECVNCAKFKGCDLSSPNVNDCVDYKEQMTEQEYIQTCNTEQLAEWLFRFRHNYRHTLSDADKMEIEDISWWLKQPHTSKE